ncbi:unnamed protein product [Prunus armeniaca]|uniref:Uncharacterized protein n=1 Tax=Prunus armeniaca TaxID=36596 RepID=A0A6J5UCB3_PRUAR|nr:unnamed protein product [Prunus armeniaca]
MFGNPDLEPITRSYGPATLFANLSSSSICRKTLMFPITCRAFLEWLVVVGVARVARLGERAPKIKGLVLEVSLYETQQRSVWVNWACQKSLLSGHYLSSPIS